MVSLPREYWSTNFNVIDNPVVPLVYALYGHPTARTWWEHKTHPRLEKVWFSKVEIWNSLFWHPTLKLLLMVYVDDLRMSGPSTSFARGWDLVR